MGIEEIPRSFKYTCDRCGTDHLQPNAGGRYTGSRPSGWVRLKINRGAFDHLGTAVGDGSFELLLCQECSAKMAEAISRVMAIANPTERA